MEAAEPQRPKYRSDIDGLRGLAVLAVVGYHAFPGLMPSGFIGVDVFFVLSGFLITGIILSALEGGRFSFAEFYARRVRRIFPSLVVVLAAVFAIGWCTLAADAFKQLGLHLIGGATFTSNLILLKESGYFDISSERKVLLHLWSLAIEEQFYLFFPLVLWAAHKRRIRPLIVIGVVALISFAWNAGVAVSNPSLDFFSPQTRVWELMIGAALACVLMRAAGRPSRSAANPVAAHAASLSGVALLALGAALIAKEGGFPGWWALLPTLGTALLIFAGAGAWINRRVLSNRALVWFGLISFPLYLWHWPLLSFAHILEGGTPSRALKLALVFLSIVLAWLTYRFVEKPLRFGKRGRTATVALLVALPLIGLIGLSVYMSGGFAGRAVAKKTESYLKYAKLTDHDVHCSELTFIDHLAKTNSFCVLGDSQEAPVAFVIGDSHVQSLRPVFEKIAKETGISYAASTLGSCPPLLDARTSSQVPAQEDGCRQLNEDVFEYVQSHDIRDVFLIARWTRYDDTFLLPTGNDNMSYRNLSDALDRTIEAYRKLGVHVFVLGDNPLQKLLPEDALRKSDFTDASINAFSVTADENASLQERVRGLLSKDRGDAVTYVDLSDAYCGNGICPLVKDGKFLYADMDHLSPSGALAAYPILKTVLNDRRASAGSTPPRHAIEHR